MIANINGDVKVVGYEGTKIQVEITKTISGKTQTRLEEGKTAIKLGVIDEVDSLIAVCRRNVQHVFRSMMARNSEMEIVG
jgi:hypothetical protein